MDKTPLRESSSKRVKLKHTPAPPTQTDSIKRVRGMTIFWMFCSSQASTAPCQEYSLSLWYLQWKNSPGGPNSGLTPRGPQWNLRRGKGLATTSTCFLEDQVTTIRVQWVVPTSSFSYLQNQAGGVFWSGKLVERISAWYRSSKKFSWPKSLVCPGMGPRSQSLPTVELGIGPNLTRRTGENTWKLCDLAILQQRGWTEHIVCTAKLVNFESRLASV